MTNFGKLGTGRQIGLLYNKIGNGNGKSAPPPYPVFPVT